MNKTRATGALCGAGLAALLVILVYRTGREAGESKPVSPQAEGVSSGPAMPQGETPAEANSDEPSQITKEQFEQLSPQEQDKAVEQFIARYWRGELGLVEEPAQQRQYLSLDVFSSPYMFTIKEAEFRELSAEDQERAMVEVGALCRQYRDEYRDLAARARESIANNDYLRAEASLISGLERARELTADKEGLLITQLVGIACQTFCLDEMERLYVKTSEPSKLARTRWRLDQLEAEKEEMRRIPPPPTETQHGR